MFKITPKDTNYGYLQGYFELLRIELFGSFLVSFVATRVAHNTAFTNGVIKCVMGMAMCPKLYLWMIQNKLT